MEFQLTFKLELYQFDSCDHELLWIIAVQQKFKKELCENQLAIWNLPKTMTYFMVICKLCVCSVMSNSLWLHGLYVTCQAPLFMEFSRQECWSRLPFPTPGDLPYPGIKSVSCISCSGRQILYHCATWVAHICKLLISKM